MRTKIKPYIKRNGTSVRGDKRKRRETITRVIDGDTFMTASRTKPIRLANYDAPEKGQRGYSSRTNALRRLIKGKKVVIDTKARDIYGRSVANVKVDGKSVNRVLKKRFKSR